MRRFPFYGTPVASSLWVVAAVMLIGCDDAREGTSSVPKPTRPALTASAPPAAEHVELPPLKDQCASIVGILNASAREMAVPPPSAGRDESLARISLLLDQQVGSLRRLELGDDLASWRDSYTALVETAAEQVSEASSSASDIDLAGMAKAEKGLKQLELRSRPLMERLQRQCSLGKPLDAP